MTQTMTRAMRQAVPPQPSRCQGSRAPRSRSPRQGPSPNSERGQECEWPPRDPFPDCRSWRSGYKVQALGRDDPLFANIRTIRKKGAPPGRKWIGVAIAAPVQTLRSHLLDRPHPEHPAGRHGDASGRVCAGQPARPGPQVRLGLAVAGWAQVGRLQFSEAPRPNRPGRSRLRTAPTTRVEV